MRIAFLCLLALLCASISPALTPREAFAHIVSAPGMPSVLTADPAGPDDFYDIRDISICLNPGLTARQTDSIRPALCGIIDSILPEYQLTEIDMPDAYVNISAGPDTAGRHDMLIFVIAKPDTTDQGAVVAINGRISESTLNTLIKASIDTTESGHVRIFDSDNPDISIIKL